MTRTAKLNAPSYLPILFAPVSPDASLLSTLSDQVGEKPGQVGEKPGQFGEKPGPVDPITALEQARISEANQVALVAADPQVRRDIAQFTLALATARTPAQLLANPAALKVLLTANGLGDQTGNPGLATRALLSNPANAGALVNQLADPRWLSVNQTYSFATEGLAVLNSPRMIGVIANGYAEELWRRSLDQTTPGLSNALDFLQRASTITNVDQVLGDPTFRAVITTALGVPEEIVAQTSTVPAQVISTQIDLTKFSDPEFVTQLTQRYLIAAQQAGSGYDGTEQFDLTPGAGQSASLVV